MVNKVILIGNVGADPEVRTLEGGNKVARLNLATTERIYNPATQERRDHTEWHRIVLWRGLADVADRFVKKGSQIYIEGKIRSREWEDEATKTKRYAIEIVADDLKLLGRRDSSQGESGGGNYGSQQSTQQARPYIAPQQPLNQNPDVPAVDDVDDLPF
jgi:single stranded DNA-binding protein (ssb)